MSLIQCRCEYKTAAQGATLVPCQWQGITAGQYGHTAFERIAEHPINRIDELLPWRLADELTEPVPRAAA